MESFSDGVFGFAATLLVADLALGNGSSALRQLLHAWPAFVAYIISFLITPAANGQSASWARRWVRMPGTRTSTPATKTARNRTPTTGNFCP